MNRWIPAATIAVALVALGSAQLVATPSAAITAAGASAHAVPSGPSTIAVVNLPKVLEGLDELDDRIAQFEQEGLERQKVVQGMREEVKRLKAVYDDLPEGHARRTELSKQALELGVRIGFEERINKEYLDAYNSEIISDMYEKAKAAASRLAQSSGYDMVINADTQTRPETVLYFDTKLDITDDLILTMNNDYARTQ